MIQSYKTYICWLVLFLSSGFVIADFNMTDWEYSKPIELGANIKEGYVKLQVDKEAFTHAYHDLSDLRIIDNQQKEIPYKLVINYQTLKETSIKSEMFNKSFVPNDKTVFTLDLGKELHKNNRLVINTTEHDFKRKAEISGSDDQQNWFLLRDDCYIFDFTTKDYHSAYTVLEYPDNNYQYLRVIIWDLEITDATVSHKIIQKAEEHLIEHRVVSQTIDSKIKASELILDFGSSGQPQYRVELTPNNENYHRKIEILGADEINPPVPTYEGRYTSPSPLISNAGWDLLGSGYIYNFNTPQIKSNQNNIDYKENTYRFIKIRVFNYDDLPLDSPDKSTRVYGVIRKVIFPAKGEDSSINYFLYYGNPHANKATYDLEKLFPYIETASIGEVKLGKETKNTQYIVRIPKIPWTEEHFYLLWVIIIVAIITMGFVILKWSKNIAETKNDGAITQEAKTLKYGEGKSPVVNDEPLMSDDEPVLPAGTNLGQYEIKEIIGRGGMGTVYKAYQKVLDRFVAIKVLPIKLFVDQEFIKRFNREAKTLASLSHPNIVAIYDMGQQSNCFYFVMEFIEGVTIRDLMGTKKLPPEEAIKIVPQICDALEYAHSNGVVHRDIKPENILIDKAGRIKITDFGLARIIRGDITIDAITKSQEIMGTYDYMAPEQRLKAKTVDHRADIYSLGVLFYEMLTGELPIGKFELPSHKIHIDVRVDDIVMKTLETDPAKRYQRASEVATAIAHIISGTGEQKTGKLK